MAVKDKRVKISVTISPEADLVLESEAKRRKVTLSLLVDACLRCYLMGECETFSDIKSQTKEKP